MNLANWADLAQIIMAAIAFLAIIASILFSIFTLKEARLDRRFRSMPHLAFEAGGFLSYIKFEKAGKTCPGFNPRYVETIFPNLPKDAESVRLKEGDDQKSSYYGRLKNYGPGTALEVEVLWIFQEMWLGPESFISNKEKLLDPLYNKTMNTIPSSPSHILSGQEASLFRVPTFIEKDYEKKVTRVKGTLEISCKDIFGIRHITLQKFHILTNYKDKFPYVIFTFGDLIKCDQSSFGG